MRATWALVPVKSLDQAKQRLEPCLGDQRGEFCLAMLQDVLNAVVDSREIGSIAVITADPMVRSLAEAQSILVITEIGSDGLNSAIRQGVDSIRKLGGVQITVMHADIPLATGAEIDRIHGSLLQHRGHSGKRAIGISPSADRQGTNILCFDVDLSIPFRYGKDSYRQHLEAARGIATPAITVDSETLSIDIDQPCDLDSFISYCQKRPEFQATRTWKYLQQNDLTTMIVQEKWMQQ